MADLKVVAQHLFQETERHKLYYFNDNGQFHSVLSQFDKSRLTTWQQRTLRWYGHGNVALMQTDIRNCVLC